MTISSRTPEGMPNHCFFCGSDICIEPSINSLDAPCPVCGQLLWFQENATEKEPTFLPSICEENLIEIGTDRLGPIALETKAELFAVLRILARLGRMPAPPELTRVLVSADGWTDVIGQLRSRLRRQSAEHWGYRAGKFVRRQLRRLFARQKQT